MSKHIPGPWRIVRGEFDQMYVHGHINFEPIAMILDAAYDRVPNEEAAKANARLIAVAPDLLRACETGRRKQYDGPEFLHEIADILSSCGYAGYAVALRIKADREQRAIEEARGIKDQQEIEERTNTNEECICAEILSGRLDATPNPDCPIHGVGFKEL